MTRRTTHGTRRAVSALAVLALSAGLAVAVPVPGGAAAATIAAEPGAVQVTGLTTNGRIDPLGIPGAAPSLGWQARSTGRGVVQTAYQVRVATSEDALGDADVWDSEKVASARQVDVTYGGPALEAHTRYVWQVRTWDGDDVASGWSEPASFETGLLDADDWGDAEWVGAAGDAELSRWRDYTADFDFSLENLAAGFYVRAADLSNGYMWQLSVADGTPRFRPHRKSGGGYALLGNVDISSVISTQQLKTGTHRLSVTVTGSTIVTKLDGTTIDTRTDATHARGFVGFRSDTATEGAETSTIHAVRVVDNAGTTLLETDFTSGNPFTGGTVVPGGLRLAGRIDALWRVPVPNLPLLRTEFDTAAGKTVTRARAYATARGIYELRINGEPVGDQHLAPGWTDYLDRIQHQTYDVTDLVEAGTNVFGAEIGSGWWAGRVAHLQTANYGKDTSLLARLRIDYSDGTSQWVDTDDADWRTAPGPYALADNIDGESYDARSAREGWDTADYDDSEWTATVTRPTATPKVVPQPDEPVRTTEERPTIRRTEPVAGRYVYDVGQNMVGVARMRLTGEAGDTVTIRYAEELNRDGTPYYENLRSAKATDTYTFAVDGTVTYEPTFTHHGFRYIEIAGAQVPPTAEDVTGVVWGSDLKATGDLETSDPMLNQLLSNISWGQRGNFLSVPTDTPARDERLGWSGDINVFAPTASYLRDTRAFLSKWMADMRDTQEANGDYQGVAPTTPNFKAGTGTGWSDAGITVPYAVWQSTGDAAIVREYWADMTRFYAMLRTSAGADLIETGRGTWGDWLNLDDPTPTSVLSTAYFAEDARMMAEMAAAIGEDAQAAEYADLSTAIRAAFTATLVAEDGTVSGNSQTGYAMALGMDLISDSGLREKAGERFVAKLARGDNHLTTGFLGTPWLLPALSSIGRDDLAYTMLLHEDYPSWGYEVAKGATTMWERWNTIMPNGEFGPVDMNSFNHYAYGAVGDWMYRNIGGIRPVEPGYHVSRIEPVVGGGLTSGAGRFESVYGPISSDWTLEGQDFALQVEVPVNTTSQVVLPASTAYAVSEGGALLDEEIDGVLDVTDDGDTVTVTVGSGSYDFHVSTEQAELGTLLEDLSTFRADVGDLAEQDELSAGDADALDTRTGEVAADVEDALQAVLDQDAAARVAALGSALDGVRGTRTWLAASGVAADVRAALDDRLAGFEARLVTAVTEARGVRVALPPLSAAALPGTVATGTIEVTNAGQSAVTGLEGTVSVAGIEEATVSLASLAAGESAQLPVSLRVSRQQDPGTYDATLALTMVVDGDSYTVTERTADWLTVTSGFAVGTPTVVLDGPDPSEHATVTVPVTNDGGAAVRAHVSLRLPAGWRSVSSSDVTVPAGGDVDVEIPVIVPVDLVGGTIEVGVDVRRAGAVLVSADRTIGVERPRPPTAAAVDHVDFGNPASENAHGIQASANSGITPDEAGVTRRYSHAGFPGSWFSVSVKVPAGQPFVLRNLETFDAARTKKYNIYVNDVLVRTQLVPRTESGQGLKVYDALIDGAVVRANTGTVRIKFEYPLLGAEGFHDPSIADMWVLAVPADEQAPDVAAVVSSGTPGEDGWHRSDVRVAVSAQDARDEAPSVETGAGESWAPYTGPVDVTGDGRHVVGYRATDAAGNRSAHTLEVNVDATAPVTTLTATRGAGVEGADSATLTFAATDATSGVASTLYRVDGGAWAEVGPETVRVQGFGDHVVDFASTDVAGNVEPMRQETVSLADVDTVAAIVAPQVTGAVRYGSTLRATSGSWNTKGLTFAYQWLRNGAAIDGARAATYRVSAADIGRRLSVRVTASKAGKAPGTSTSAPTAPVAKTASRTTVKVNKATVKRGKPVKVTVVVAADPRATGRVAVRVDGKVVKRATLRAGRAVVRIKVRKPGRHRVSASYLGSTITAASSATARTIRVRTR
ncbi:MAG TPA: family 78 glycoside hydrolase catalytic domain [Nocardioides sp.]|uniref:family 78 glycoside hydrolase catalytic domain n=1 Tax=Nocardioides sp. TaxID=35761 RepID=UPI002BE9EAF2|nr:family 78 glycoside hydrolase catalytic domain [Nocardioides sp.]HTW16771.1 family 78 glycoside hydrolase catalytic domain [Nocardioides sp.]